MASPGTLPELANQATKYLQLGTSSALEHINPDVSVGRVQTASCQGRNAFVYQGKMGQNKVVDFDSYMCNALS